MSTSGWIIIILALVFGPVLISYIVEALRPKPGEPSKLSWDKDIPIEYVDVNGVRIRYITVGEGTPLVLLHTLRTQLDIFQKVIPELSKYFKVYAPDYPGHGWSDITNEKLKPEVFYKTAAGFLDALDINDAIVAGISIGGTISLVLAARHNPRIKKVISINPYDYGSGGGIQRSSGIARIIFTLASIPVLGDTVMRMRNRMIEDQIFQGGVYTSDAIPESLLEEFYLSGCRPGHYKSFLSLVRNAGEWDKDRREYKNINVPVLLLYGEDDWSYEIEREANQRDIPGVEMVTIERANHFLSLDAPDAFISNILEFSGVAA
jgi:pimeloyl-ACP methyl ester carboxylesterase